MSAVSQSLLEADRVGVVRGRRRVLGNISAQFQGGAWTAIVGPNGAGKSTLLSTLAGLIRPKEGTVRLAGRPIQDWSDRERAQRLTWFGQSAVSEADIAAHEVVRLGRLPRYGLLGAPTAADEAAVRSALEESEATAFAHRRLGELSAGERQRVLLARAFSAEAPVALYDEPTIHLDAPHQRRLIHSLKSRARGGAVVISVLHDLTLALAADRLMVLADGEIRADGAPDEVLVRDTMTRVFDNAFSVEPLISGGLARWAAVPIL